MMLATIDPWIFGFSAVTVVATIWMGFWAARKSKTASDFFVAGRSVSVGWNASAISGEYLSAASFMGVAGMVMAVGYDALWYPVCYACGYLFLLLFIAGPLRRFGAYTVPDLAEGRFDSPVFRKIAVVFVLFIGFFYTMPQMKGAGTTLAYIFPGLPYWAGVVLVGAVITLNVALGGMKGITLVQAFQYWAKMFAISVPIFVLMAVYGNYGKQLEVNGNVQHPTSNNQLSTNAPGAAALNAERSLFPQSPNHETWENCFLKIVDGGVTNGAFHEAALKTGFFKVHGGTTPSQSTVEILAKNYASARAAYGRVTIYLERGIATNQIVYPAVPSMSLKQSVQLLAASLKTNGIAIQEVTSRTFKFFPEASAERFASIAIPEQGATLRKPLPEKAPADSTWVSPFGPLTTKAAKAIPPVIILPDNLITNREVPSLRYGQIRYFGGGPQFIPPGPNAVNFLLNEPAFDASRLATYYFDSVLLNEGLTNTNNFNYILSPALSDLRLKAEFGSLNPSQAIEKIGALFATNGITLRRLSENSFVALPAKDVVMKPVDTRPYALLYTYSLIIALVCGTAGLPHILVRFYTNPDGAAAKRTTMWVMILIGVFYVFPPVFGVMGRNLLPELYAATGAKGTDKIVLELPRLLNEKYAPLGSILSGITCAGAFAAFMSTFSGLLVSMTGAMAHDVYGRMLNPKATQAQRMRAFKIAAVLVGGVAILLGTLVEPLQINFMVGQAFAIAAASYFPLLFMCAWWRNLTMKGAATGMLTGGLAAVFAISLTSFSDLAKATDKTAEFFAVFKPMNEFWAAHPLLRILCEQPAIWAVPLAIGLMVIVSKLTRKEVPADIRMKMLVLHAPEKLGLKQEYIQEHQHH